MAGMGIRKGSTAPTLLSAPAQETDLPCIMLRRTLQHTALKQSHKCSHAPPYAPAAVPAPTPAAAGPRSAPARRSRRNQLRRSGAVVAAGVPAAVGVVAVEAVVGKAFGCFSGMPAAAPLTRHRNRLWHMTGAAQGS